MSSNGQPPDRVPTLTEVVVMPDEPFAPAPPVPSVEADMMAPAPAPVAAPAVRHAPAISEEQLIQHVLADVQRQVELMLEVRLREALTPILTRTADSVVRDARSELASTLRDVVARAVAQELARHRDR